MNTEFVNVNPENVIDESQKLKFAGYHLMQQCATRIPDAFELIYTFGKDLEVKQLKITLPVETEISSITSIFPCAFIYENEMHDLFGVKIKMINIDYEGKLYRTAIETPFK
ncbi:MAG: NADH-quinone oxidoreductase subunit C [Butyrivibrio sp.]|nr:NADH-quinone oxidoreductase subunit C [Butyrivibrio sp.]